MSEMKQVSVPPEYFVKAKNDYADWRFAFFREFNQNSADAGATNISYEIQALENDGCRIIAHDNGSGMDLHTCETKFLALRQSTKTGSDGCTGAFGVAKEIIAFAHESFVLESQDYKIVGRGGDYQVFKVQDHLKGVRITVEMSDATKEGMSKKLEQWVELSSFACEISLNGKPLVGCTTTYPHSFEVDFGQIAFRETQNPEYHYSQLVVKMNGMAMYRREVYTNGGAFEAVLNLNGSSQERLTSNRDSLTGNLESLLTQVLNRLANDRSQLTLGKPMVFEFNKKAPAVIDDEESQDQDENIVATGNETMSDIINQLAKRQQLFRYGSNDVKESAFTKNLSRMMLKREYKSFESMQTKIEEAIGGVTESLFPHNWVVRISATENKSVQANIKRLNKLSFIRLAYTWQILVTYVIKNCGLIWVDTKEDGTLHYRGKPIKFGFVLDNVKALYVSDESISILLNPFKDRELYTEDFETLVSRAVHEVAHIVAEDHNEYFVDRIDEAYINLRRAIRNDSSLKGNSMKSLERLIKENLPAGRY
ncbi:MAG: ATP-binding protein [Hafnia sp.]